MEHMYHVAMINKIDHILLTNRYSQLIKNVRTYREIGSNTDYFLIRADTAVQKQKNEKSKENKTKL